MLRKCQYCDKNTSEKSVDIVVDDYIYVQKSGCKQYWHTFCYKKYLHSVKKMTEEDAIREITFIKSKMQKISDEKIYRDKLCKHLMDWYDITLLPTYFFIKLQKINDGNYKQCPEAITNQELYEMYTNEKQINKMNVIAQRKGIALSDRLNWDLAIILSDYGKYKKWKMGQIDPTQVESQKIKNIIEDIKKTKIKHVQKQQSDDTIKIKDLLDYD